MGSGGSGYGGTHSGGGTIGSHDSGSSSGPNTFPPDRSQTDHMFGEREGHLPDTPANRRLIEDLANDDSCKLGSDKWGKEWYARMNPDGTQTWVSVRDGVIQDCGENTTPRPWDPEAGLSANKPKRNGFKRKRGLS